MTRGGMALWLLGWLCVWYAVTLQGIQFVGMFITLKKPIPFGMEVLLATVGAIAIRMSKDDKPKH